MVLKLRPIKYSNHIWWYVGCQSQYFYDIKYGFALLQIRKNIVNYISGFQRNMLYVTEKRRWKAHYWNMLTVISRLFTLSLLTSLSNVVRWQCKLVCCISLTGCGVLKAEHYLSCVHSTAIIEWHTIIFSCLLLNYWILQHYRIKKLNIYCIHIRLVLIAFRKHRCYL